MGSIDFRERRLFSLFSSTFVVFMLLLLQFHQIFIIKGEVFSAFNEWETLIRMENNFVKLLEDFITTNGEKLPRMDDLKHFLNEVKPRVMEAVESPEKFISHPVNGFLLIKRFTSDWLEIELILRNYSSKAGLCY